MYDLQRLVHTSGQFPLLCGNWHGVLRHCAPSLSRSGHRALQCYFLFDSIRERLQNYFCCFQTHFFLYNDSNTIYQKSQLKQNNSSSVFGTFKEKSVGRGGQQQDVSSRDTTSAASHPSNQKLDRIGSKARAVANYHTEMSSPAQNIIEDRDKPAIAKALPGMVRLRLQRLTGPTEQIYTD